MKKNIGIISILLLLSLCIFSNVYAIGFEKTTETQSNNATKKYGAYIEDKCNVAENIDGCLAALGETVNVSGNVKGISFVLGDSVNLRGTTEYLFLLGNTINLDTSIFKDSFILGATVNITSKNMLGRDAVILASTLNLSGEAKRDVTITAETVKIHDATILGNIRIDADNIVISGDTKILGTLTYYDDSNIDMANTVVVSNVSILKAPAIEEPTKESIFISKVKKEIFTIATVAVVLLVLSCATSTFTNIDKKVVNNLNIGDAMVTMVTGFLVLSLTPIVIVILLVTIIGMPAAIILLILYIIGIWLSNAFTGYVLVKHLFKNKKIHTIIVVILGLMLVTLLCNIPIISGVFKFISLIFGMGVYTYIFKKNKKNKTGLIETKEDNVEIKE